jgi:hypothetical protein
MSALRLLAGLSLVLAVGVAVAGCGITRVVTPPADTLASWVHHPLAPDPALATQALAARSACLMDATEGQVRILVQDRRTAQTAAFLVASATMFGSCIITNGSGSSSGGGGPAPGAMAGPISVDSNAGGGAGSAQTRLLGGRVVSQASRVVVALADGRTVIASLNGGYWLAWWPDTTFATTVAAFDSAGAALGKVEVIQ